MTTISVRSPNAPNEDFETLMSDPITGDLYLLRKNRLGHKDNASYHEPTLFFHIRDDELEAQLYRLTPPATSNKDAILLKDVGVLKYEFLVAGDISRDGKRILIRQGKNAGAWMYFRDDVSQSVEDVLLGTGPCDLVLFDEEQGESIAVDPEVKGFYTLSEGDNKPVWYYGFMN